MAGLRSLDSVSGSHYYSRLMEKIKAGSSNFIGGNDTILFDLSSWDKESISEKISKLYNPYRNLYLDKCYGESKTPLGEWMYFPTDEED